MARYFAVYAVRSFSVLQALPILVLGTACASPLPELDAQGSSGSTEVETGTVADDTAAGPLCGNGVVEAGETCDDDGESVTCDADCTLVECGDGVANGLAGEQCDREDLESGTCSDFGFAGGTLSCDFECAYDTSECNSAAPNLQLSFSQTKRFDFDWTTVEGANYYQLLESREVGGSYAQIGGDIVGDSISLEMPLHRRLEASYMLRACNAEGCVESKPVDVASSLVDAVGYFKASNTGESDDFGFGLALSEDGATLAVSATGEDSSAAGVDGDQDDDSASQAGAVYIFARDYTGMWSQQAYIKASNADTADFFGWSLSLSSDGDTLAVGARDESSDAVGLNGNSASNAANVAGAAYVFVRDRTDEWSLQAYVKASNADAGDRFGWSVALSGDGTTLAVGAREEDGGAIGINGDPYDDSVPASGAVYVFTRDKADAWSQQAYIKASNTGTSDHFGFRVVLDADGDTLAVSGINEDSSATGIDGNQVNESASDSGAVYVFVRDDMATWSQQAYVKASNTDLQDQFGWSLALSGDGDTLAISAYVEDSDAIGIDGNQANESAPDAGAVYVFVRDGMETWSQQVYIKASNAEENDRFGYSAAMSASGNVLVVGSRYEDSSFTGLGGNQSDASATDSGAVYVFVRDEANAWSQRAYVKASNTSELDSFSSSMALSGDGNTLAVGARYEDSSASGVNGNQADDSATGAGAVYLY